MNLPETLLKLNKIFKEEKAELFLVGGAIRNYILRKDIKDYDCATNLTPDKMLEIAAKNEIKCIETGIEHGTVTFVIDEDHYEVTTYRTESTYSDNRHPDEVKFVTDIKIDMERRDFTVNAMYMDISTEQIYNLTDDTTNKLIKCVGDPSERFKEDALRMLRAIRFASQLGFYIDKPTFGAIVNWGYLLNSISKERIQDELCKILMSDNHVFGMNLLKQTGLLHFISFELEDMIGCAQNNQHHIFNVWDHTMMALKPATKDLEIRLALLFHDTGKPIMKTKNEYGMHNFIEHGIASTRITQEFMDKFKFDNKTKIHVAQLVKYHDDPISCNKPKKIKKFINKLGPELFGKLISVQISDKLAQNGLKQDLVEELKSVLKLMPILLLDPIYLRDLTVDGDDMQELGLSGADIGLVLNRLLSHVWSRPQDNTREELLKLVKGMRND
jgi:tRNA nucleotidyltransferase (CCA-adding enzyme)